jgi:hypothetical protein
MEEWFHNCNDKEEVNNARPLIAKVLKWLQELIPREEGTNGYCIPKMHGMTKFQSYIKKYGSTMNFYGGPGESAHKFFVKAPGQKTQRRVSEFAIQTTNQYYDIMVTRYALRSVDIYENIVTESRSVKYQFDDSLRNADEVSVEFSGKCSLVVTNKTVESMRNNDDIYVTWNKDNKKVKKDNVTYCLHRELVRVILRKLEGMNMNDFSQGYLIEGYTRVTTKIHDGTKLILYAHPNFQGKKWYDWAYVHFEELKSSGEAIETYHSSKILGFVTIHGITEAVIQCSEKPLIWSDLEEKFILKTIIGTNIDVSYVTVPISLLVHPLCVIPDYG